jgi:glycosyltransferase involved in cell wall biosynthesis
MPSITVIIPLYNKEHYVLRAVQSLLAQTQKPDQIIIINDASTDNSVAVLQPILIANQGLIELFQNETNKGVSYTRNVGISKASSDYIMFLDADDSYDIHFIELVKKETTNNSQQNIFISACKYVPDDFIYPLIPKPYLENSQQINYSDKLAFIPFVGGSNVILRKSFIQKSKLEFDIEETNYEDWLLYFSLLALKDSLSRKEEKYQYIKLPKLISILEKEGKPNTKKLAYSIWLSSSYNKINSRFNYLNFLSKHRKTLLQNFSLNKYTMQVISKFFLPIALVNNIKNIIRNK